MLSIFTFTPIVGLFMVFIAPLLIGNLFVKKDEYFFDGGFRYTTGLVAMLAILYPFESITIRRQTSFVRMCNYYSAAIIVLCSVSVWLFCRRKQYTRFFRESVLQYIKKNKSVIVLFALVIFSTIRNAAFMRINYSDDGNYTTLVNDILYTDRLFALDYLKGEWLNYYEISYKNQHMAIVVFYAFFAKTLGIHPTFMLHTLSPLIWTPMTFVILWKLTGTIYVSAEDVKKRVICLSVVWLMLETWWSGWDTTLSLNFFSGIWWGKSFVQFIAIPFITYLFFAAWDKKLDLQDYCLWLCASVASTAGSLMGPVLVPFVVIGLSTLYMIRKRTTNRILVCLLCCIPSGLVVLEVLNEMIKR